MKVHKSALSTTMRCAGLVVCLLQFGCKQQPKWLQMLPPEVTPDRNLVGQLEEVRKDFRIAHEEFAFRVGNSHAAFRKVGNYILEQLRKEKPQESERDLLCIALILYLKGDGYQLPAPEAVGYWMRSIFSLDDLSDCQVSLEHLRAGYARNPNLERRINKLLR